VSDPLRPFVVIRSNAAPKRRSTEWPPSVRRSRARQARAVEKACRLAERGIATRPTRGFVEAATPEQLCLANELERALREEARGCGCHGESVLDGLLRGEARREPVTAGVSTATVSRTMRKLRERVVELDYRGARMTRSARMSRRESSINGSIPTSG
jgi:hypothetical protein